MSRADNGSSCPPWEAFVVGVMTGRVSAWFSRSPSGNRIAGRPIVRVRAGGRVLQDPAALAVGRVDVAARVGGDPAEPLVLGLRAPRLAPAPERDERDRGER